MTANELSIDHFSAIDLRVARILEVQDHPNAEKLYVLVVDLGQEQRQIVAGIKSSYAPETLIGRKIILLSNVKKAVIRGVESFGMLLAGRSADRTVILSPSEDIDIGVRLS